MTTSTIYAAWSCKLDHGSQALTLTALNWSGTTLQRAVIDDRRSLEAAATRPADAPQWARAQQDPTLGSLVTDATGAARVSWARAAPYATGSVPDIYEATISPQTIGSPTLALAEDQIPVPARSAAARDREANVGWYGPGIGSAAENFGLFVTDYLAPKNTEYRFFLHRDATGSWQAQQLAPLDVELAGGGREVFPIADGFALSANTGSGSFAAAITTVP